MSLKYDQSKEISSQGVDKGLEYILAQPKTSKEAPDFSPEMNFPLVKKSELSSKYKEKKYFFLTA